MTPEERHAALLHRIDLLEEAIDKNAGMPDALRTVAELHAPEHFAGLTWQCQGCDPGSNAEHPPEWPCRTITALETSLRIGQ